jgi:FkbM family methyltransferase
MFNECDPKKNGEQLFFNKIKGYINVIFDVGCREDSEFLDFKGEVHYFDPVQQFINNLSNQTNKNSVARFNVFGLGNENKALDYYPRYQSFYDRTASCGVRDEQNKIILNIKKASEYIQENNIIVIDFVKIDTEGYELNVLQGFGDYIRYVTPSHIENAQNGIKIIYTYRI